MNQKVFLAASPVLLLACMANAEQENSWNASLGAEVAVTDNAKKTKDLQKIEERQDKYTFDVSGKYLNDWVLADTSYLATSQKYEKASQPDRNFVDGMTMLRFGNDYDFASLNLSHSRRTVLNAPDAIELSSNFESRDIIRAEPQLSWRVSSADLIGVRGDFTWVRLDKTPIKNSDTNGASLVYQREISKTDNFQLMYTSSQIEFPNAPLVNYDFENYAATYQVKLRNLSYLIQAGVNKADNKLSPKSWSSPAYNFGLTYKEGLNLFELRYSQSITNSSSGDGNLTSLVNGLSSNSGAGLDLINKKTAEFIWSSNFVCERCNLSASASKSKEDYQSLAEDGDLTAYRVSAGYQFTRTISVSVNVGQEERKFEGASDAVQRTPYTQKRAEFSLGFEPFKSASLRLFARQVSRESGKAINSTFDENMVGLLFSYGLR